MWWNSKWPLHCKFSGDCSGERIFKIGQYMTKLCVEHLGFTFLGPPCTYLLTEYEFKFVSHLRSRYAWGWLAEISRKFCSVINSGFLSLGKKVKVKKRIAVSGIPSHSYGTSLAIWDHTVLPATRHKWTCPAFTPASKPVLDLPTPEGWKAELT